MWKIKSFEHLDSYQQLIQSFIDHMEDKTEELLILSMPKGGD